MKVSTLASVGTLALTLSVSACSGGTPDAAQLTKDAKQSASTAKSTTVRIDGTMADTKTTMTVTGTMDGSNQTQTQVQGQNRSDGVVLGRTAYLKANAGYWQAIGASKSQASKLADKWWTGTANADQSPAVNVKEVVNEFFTSDDGKALASKDAKVAETQTGGQDTYTITNPKKSGAPALIVTRGDTTQIVQIKDFASKLTTTKATFTFSGWNTAKTVTAPAGAKPISAAGIGTN